MRPPSALWLACCRDLAEVSLEGRFGYSSLSPSDPERFCPSNPTFRAISFVKSCLAPASLRLWHLALHYFVLLACPLPSVYICRRSVFLPSQLLFCFVFKELANCDQSFVRSRLGVGGRGVGACKTVSCKQRGSSSWASLLLAKGATGHPSFHRPCIHSKHKSCSLSRSPSCSSAVFSGSQPKAESRK